MNDDVLKYRNIIIENANQLVDYYDHIFTSMVIIKINTEKANLIITESNDLYRLFLLKLGINIETNINEILQILDRVFDYENADPYVDIDNFSVDRLRDILAEIVQLIHKTTDKI